MRASFNSINLLFVPVGVTLLLSGCNFTPKILNPFNRVNTSSSSTQSPGQAVTFSFPKDNCLYEVPASARPDSVEVVPVMLKVTRQVEQGGGTFQNIMTIRNKFCRNFLNGKLKKGQNYYFLTASEYQVASFLDLEQANKFKKMLNKELGDDVAEVGNPIPIGSYNAQKKDLRITEEVGQAAGLKTQEIEQLLSLQNLEYSFKTSVRVIVPTYLPPGFKVEKVKINTKEPTQPSFEIVYSNSDKYCFAVSEYLNLGDAPIFHETIMNIYSPALGYVNLGYIKYDEYIRGVLISNSPLKINDQGQVKPDVESGEMDKEGGYFFIFSSPVLQNNSPCKAVDIEEAVKIFESLHFLKNS